MSRKSFTPPATTPMHVQTSIRIGPLRFERFQDKLRIALMYAANDDREVALIESKEMLKLKLWLNGDL